MSALDESNQTQGNAEPEMVKFPASLTMQDDRAKITVQERDKIIKQFFDGDTLKQFPKKQKKKLVLLHRISGMFNPEKRYTENDVNMILMGVYEDYVMIRRYLIEYGFLNRKPDGSEYWVEK